VNVALATDRPLLLRGPSGSGKSTLARFVSWCLGWAYEHDVVTSRTQAHELLYRFDAVRRLADASVMTRKGLPGKDEKYVEPGVLWRSFDPIGVKKRFKVDHDEATRKPGTVTLLDEVDKADPDVPNDLLVAIEQRWFRIPELDLRIDARAAVDRPVLVMITSNGERELPRAFMRRCITCDLARPGLDEMERIARAHHPDVSDPVLAAVKKGFDEVSKSVADERLRPSTAEFLDAIRALQGVSRAYGTEEEIVRRALVKHLPESEALRGA